MTRTQSNTSIYILDGDPTLAISQKYLLETHQHPVEILNHSDALKFSRIAPKDIMLIDIAINNPKNFQVLDVLLQVPIRPKLLITAFENQIFNKDDFLEGGPTQILFKPFPPSDLISAVTDLARTPHA